MIRTPAHKQDFTKVEERVCALLQTPGTQYPTAPTRRPWSIHRQYPEKVCAILLPRRDYAAHP